MINPFEPFRITHLSPSSILKFAEQPAAFVLEKILNVRSPVGPAAHRGTAAEAGIEHGLRVIEAPISECIEMAAKKFRSLSAFTGGDKADKEAAAIPGMVEQGLKELRPYGAPSHFQMKVSRQVEGLAVPIIGVVDFFWEQHGVLTDLKTTHAVPSQVKPAHSWQVANYGASLSDNLDLRVSYVSGKKAVTYRVDDVRAHAAAMDRAALNIQRWLSLSTDPEFFIGITVPATDHFYYADPQARQALWQHWRI